MKLNKKLLMAALAGAIVVGGGVNTFADDEPGAIKVDKAPEAPSQELKLTKEEAEKALEKEKPIAKARLKRLGITSEFILNQIDKATSREGLESLVQTIKQSYLKDHPIKEEEEKDVSDSWYDQSKHPFAYRTKAEAEAAAKKALENELLNPGHINNGYEVAQTSDGNWDYVLKIVDKSEEKTPEKPSNPDVKPNPSKPERQPSTPEGPYAPYAPEKGKEEKPGKDQKPGEDKKPEDKKPGKKEKENTDSPNKKNKKKLPKAGSEAEILTLAAASLSSVAGAFISLKKRK